MINFQFSSLTQILPPTPTLFVMLLGWTTWNCRDSLFFRLWKRQFHKVQMIFAMDIHLSSVSRARSQPLYPHFKSIVCDQWAQPWFSFLRCVPWVILFLELAFIEAPVLLIQPKPASSQHPLHAKHCFGQNCVFYRRSRSVQSWAMSGSIYAALGRSLRHTWLAPWPVFSHLYFHPVLTHVSINSYGYHRSMETMH